MSRPRAVVTDVFPCENGHAQERSLFGAVLDTVEAGDLWIEDRNFCTRAFLCEIDKRGAFFVTREHQGLQFEILERPALVWPHGRRVKSRSNACKWWMRTATSISFVACVSS